MKKLISAVLVFSLTAILPAARADGPPAADLSCSLIDTGVRYGVSMTFTGSGVSFSSLTYEWEYAILLPGTNPQYSSNYGPRTAFTRTSGNGLDLSYESMLSYAKNDPNATIILFAASIFSDGLSTLTNRTGKGCYVDLPTVKNSVDQATTTKIANDAASKAAAEAQAKAAAEAAAKAAADAAGKASSDTTNASERAALISSIAKKDIEIQSTIVIAIQKYPTMRGNLGKFLNSKPVMPDQQKATISELTSSLDAFTIFKNNLDTFIASMAKSLPTTISCVKGKVIKKVTAVKPKCPSGYKQS